MVDDTFLFTLNNPAEPFFDIVHALASSLTNTDIQEVIEGGVLDYETTPFKIVAGVKNIGGVVGTKDVVLYDGSGLELERKEVIIEVDMTFSVHFDNGTLGYELPDGTTRDFQLKSG